MIDSSDYVSGDISDSQSPKAFHRPPSPKVSFLSPSPASSETEQKSLSSDDGEPQIRKDSVCVRAIVALSGRRWLLLATHYYRARPGTRTLLVDYFVPRRGPEPYHHQHGMYWYVSPAVIHLNFHIPVNFYGSSILFCTDILFCFVPLQVKREARSAWRASRRLVPPPLVPRVFGFFAL